MTYYRSQQRYEAYLIHQQSSSCESIWSTRSPILSRLYHFPRIIFVHASSRHIGNLASSFKAISRYSSNAPLVGATERAEVLDVFVHFLSSRFWFVSSTHTCTPRGRLGTVKWLHCSLGPTVAGRPLWLAKRLLPPSETAPIETKNST